MTSMIASQKHDKRFASRIDYLTLSFCARPNQNKAGVWLGTVVTVTKGTSIGEGGVTWANAVITKDIPTKVLGYPSHSDLTP